MLSKKLDQEKKQMVEREREYEKTLSKRSSDIQVSDLGGESSYTSLGLMYTPKRLKLSRSKSIVPTMPNNKSPVSKAAEKDLDSISGEMKIEERFNNSSNGKAGESYNEMKAVAEAHESNDASSSGEECCSEVTTSQSTMICASERDSATEIIIIIL